MCRVQETLSKHAKLDGPYEDESLTPAVDAFKRKRLTFAWLDGEKQQVTLFLLLLLFSFVYFLL